MNDKINASSVSCFITLYRFNLEEQLVNCLIVLFPKISRVCTHLHLLHDERHYHI